MYREAKLLYELLCEEVWDRRHMRSASLLASLERRLIGTVKDEDGVYRECDQAK
jgi:hypothetical protein